MTKIIEKLGIDNNNQYTQALIKGLNVTLG